MNKAKKLLSAVLVGTAVMTVAPVEANAAWKQDNNGWWYTEGNSYVRNDWRLINGSWYYFDNSGYMKTGWLKDGDKWYYLDKSGAMKTGWLYDGDKIYYLNNSGVMQTGWFLIGDDWYYAEASGAMKSEWLEYNGNWYYLEYNGKMMKNTWMHEGYYLNNEGIWDGSSTYRLNDFMSADGTITCKSGKKLGVAGAPGPIGVMNNEPTRFCMGSLGDDNYYYIGMNTLNVYDYNGNIIDKANLINK